jgi:hypothetical protein
MSIRSDVVATARWFKGQFAEWAVGSWALIIGWVVFSTIFLNFLLMDGHFSRGLGEGSGVNPDRFQQVGWMYRLFAATFLMLGTKLALMGLKGHAWALRIIGAFITLIVILHATGFGLKALEGKRDTAAAVEAVAATTVESNEALIVTLEGRQDKIRADLKLAVEPLKARMAQLDKDGEFNEQRTDALQARVAALENAAQQKIDDIDAEILAKTVSGGEARIDGAEKLATNEEWAPLFVGLAQLFTWSQTPSDWAIYICAVLFIIFWVLVGDSIAIILPDALYAIHLKDAKNQKINISVDAFKDLQAQADELTRRKANLQDGAERANISKKKKKNRSLSKTLLEDQRPANVKQADAEKRTVDDAIAEMSAEYVDEPDEQAEQAEETEQPERADEPEAPAAETAEESDDVGDDDDDARQSRAA